MNPYQLTHFFLALIGATHVICFCLCVLCVQLVLDSQKRVFSWGFGGYGRLGHTEQKDEMVPRLVKLFDFPGRGASQIYCGYQCSFAVSEMGKPECHVCFWLCPFSISLNMFSK